MTATSVLPDGFTLINPWRSKAPYVYVPVREAQPGTFSRVGSPPLKEERIPVVIGPCYALPSTEVELITRSEKLVATPEAQLQAESSKPKAPSNEQIWKVIYAVKESYYNIVKQLRKQPAHISLLDLIHSSDKHREMLEKFLPEVHVPEQVEVNALDSYMNGMLANNAITFSEDDLPEQGSDHNSALFITLKCRDTTVSKVLIDGGSGVNIIPLAVAQNLGVNLEKLPPSSLTIRTFDGAKR
ncbi:hypothetical protein MLD38_011107 [Melastoma candidum]|uniref:Uncharacterized protein n=1 Tax=Melastoma candidum TaxID=119954 RepID=A0ACB9R1N6_9MYRT|nr:hypothetical protein MLD38_011107 [Melastoma candidum]